MSDLKIREEKIKEKRKHTPRRQVIKEIASWMPMMLYRNNGLITPYPPTMQRVGNIMNPQKFDEYRINMPEIPYNGDLLSSMREGFQNATIAGQKIIMQNENAEFNYIIGGVKNAYLSIVAVESENVAYSYAIFGCSDVFGSILVEGSQNVYQSRCVYGSSNIFYASSINNSHDVRLSANLVGCSHCIRCNGLSNQSYCVDNVSVGKEEFEKELHLLQQNNGSLLGHYTTSVLKIPGDNVGESITGEFNRMCSHVEDCYMTYQLKNSRNVVLCNATGMIEDCIDCISIGGAASDNIYASMGVGYNSHHVYCSVECSPNCSNIYYSYLMDSCSHCLGCIGLRNKSFCILNKQYTQGERFDKANELLAHMEENGTLGQFFPGSMNPFYFNDTVAYLIDDGFSKDEVVKEGFLWRDDEIKVDVPNNAEVVETKDLNQYHGYNDQGERKINPEIVKKVIKDAKGNYYRIMPMELEFLQKHGLPLPELHWLERIKLGFKFK